MAFSGLMQSIDLFAYTERPIITNMQKRHIDVDGNRLHISWRPELLPVEMILFSSPGLEDHNLELFPRYELAKAFFFGSNYYRRITPDSARLVSQLANQIHDIRKYHGPIEDNIASHIYGHLHVHASRNVLCPADLSS
jgi:hypothetical protein